MDHPLTLPRATVPNDPTDCGIDLAAFLAKPDGGSGTPGLDLLPRVEVFTSFEEAEPLWRAFEVQAQGSVYQRYDWCKIWFDTFHGDGKATPLITVIRLNDQPVLLVPLFGEVTKLGIKHALFMGGSHANARIPLVTADASVRACMEFHGRGGSIVELIGQALTEGHHADFLALDCMPESFAGQVNVLALGDREKCSSLFFAGEIYADYEALKMERRPVASQRKQRKRFRQLQALGTHSFDKIEDAATLDRMLDVFFAQKAKRLDNSHVYNAFDDPKNETFLRRLAHDSLQKNARTLELYALNLNGEPIAIAGGGVQADRFSMGINSMSARSEFVACSPGRISVDYAVEHLCAEGFTSFDLGIGENEYKRMWCSAVDLYQVNRVLTAEGRALQRLSHLRNVTVTKLKRFPALVRLLKRVQFHVKRLGSPVRVRNG